MTALVWDQPGDRRYEAGIDHGVLYIPGGAAVPWNGLISVNEARSREVKSFFMDGFRYFDYSIPGAYAAKLQAFTYPDELEDLVGNREIWPGVNVSDQRAKRFHLSYQTRIGNDLENEDYGFHLHLVYNVTAMESDVTFNTIGEAFSGVNFEWNLSGVPNVAGSEIFSFGPSSHFSIHSRRLGFTRVGNLLNHLYGTDTTAPAMPDLSTLASIATA